MNPGHLMAVARVSFREFWRSPEAVFWTYGFPLLMTVVLGFAFQPKEPDPIRVAVVAGQGAEELGPRLMANPRLLVLTLSEGSADEKLARGMVEAVVRGTAAAPILRADPARPDAELARIHCERALAQDAGSAVVFEPEDRPGARYIDFLVPGLIGLNLLGSGLWGVGFQLVQFRSQRLLRRLFVTPLSRGEFLGGFLISRLLLAVPESIVIGLFGIVLFGVPLRGSLLAALCILGAGALAFTGLGVLLASRARTVEGIAGLMNLALLPMWLLGGAFFSNERMTGLLRVLADCMPLSWCNGALRDVMLGEAGLAQVAGPVGLLLLFAAACHAAALRLFRWT